MKPRVLEQEEKPFYVTTPFSRVIQLIEIVLYVILMQEEHRKGVVSISPQTRAAPYFLFAPFLHFMLEHHGELNGVFPEHGVEQVVSERHLVLEVIMVLCSSVVLRD